jgi:hypothetical protein
MEQAGSLPNLSVSHLPTTYCLIIFGEWKGFEPSDVQQIVVNYSTTLTPPLSLTKLITLSIMETPFLVNSNRESSSL